MTSERSDGRSASRVVVIQASLVDPLRSGLLRDLSETTQRLSVIAGQREINTEVLYPELARFDIIRQLLEKIGFSGHGARPEDVSVTEADHPDLVLRSLEATYAERLAVWQDLPSAVRRSSSVRILADLGELVAALRERLARPNGGKQI